MQGLFNFLLRLVLLVVGLVFAASLMLAAACLLAFWGLRAGWAKLTGRPVTPFVVRIHPRGGFARVYRGGQAASSPQPGHAPSRREEIADVTDVVPKE